MREGVHCGVRVANRPFGERQSTYAIAGFWASSSGAGVGVFGLVRPR